MELMDEKTRDAMQKIIAAKKEKSANQNNQFHKPDNSGNTLGSRKKHRKGGLFDK